MRNILFSGSIIENIINILQEPKLLSTKRKEKIYTLLGILNYKRNMNDKKTLYLSIGNFKR